MLFSSNGRENVALKRMYLARSQFAVTFACLFKKNLIAGQISRRDKVFLNCQTYFPKLFYVLE